jgi:hypothetical protein
VELASPVEIPSIKSALARLTSISPTGHIQMIPFQTQKFRKANVLELKSL